MSPRHASRLPSLPIAVVAIVMLIQRLRLPAFLAIMATVVVYGIAADMTFQSVGKAFGLGFTAALEQAGLLVVAGALVRRLVLRQPLGTGTSAAGRRAGGTRRLGDGRPRPAAAGRPGRAAPRARPRAHPAGRRCPGGALAARRCGGLGDEGRHCACMLDGRLPLAAIAALLGWWYVARQVPANTAPGRLGWAWLAIVIPDRAPDRAVGGADAERAPGQGRRARILYRHLQAADAGRHRHHAGRAVRRPLAALGAGRPQLGAAPAGGRRGGRARAACSTRPAWPSFSPNTRSIRATASSRRSWPRPSSRPCRAIR